MQEWSRNIDLNNGIDSGCTIKHPKIAILSLNFPSFRNKSYDLSRFYAQWLFGYLSKGIFRGGIARVVATIPPNAIAHFVRTFRYSRCVIVETPFIYCKADRHRFVCRVIFFAVRSIFIFTRTNPFPIGSMETIRRLSVQINL